MKATVLLVAGLLAAAVPLAAQQPAAAEPAAPAVAPAAAPAAPAATSAMQQDTARVGPRVREAQPTVRATFRSSADNAFRYRDSQTITIGTVTLLLIIILIVLLVK